MKRALALVLCVVSLTGCSGWNSQGKLINTDGAPVTNPQPVPVNVVSGNVSLNGTLSGNVAVTNTPLPISGNVNIGNSPTVNVANNTSSVYIFDTTGTPKGLIIDDGELAAHVEDMMSEIAMEGLWMGRAGYNFHLIGRRAGFSDTTSLQDVKQFDTATALFPPDLAGNESLEIVSTSASDSAAGTGARSVQVMYLDSNYNLVISGNITLNGLTPVPAGFTARAIENMVVMTHGTLEVAAGDIVIRTVVGTVNQEMIAAGGNKSLSSHFMVPVNFTAYIMRWDSTSIWTGGAGSAAAQDVRIRATIDNNGKISDSFHFIDAVYLASGTASGQINLPLIKVPAKGKIKASTISTSTSSNARVDVSYCIVILHN